MTSTSSIVRSDDIRRGRPRIAGTGVTVRRIVVWYKQGFSPEEIVREIPHLSLAQVYAALTYYHANHEEIEADLAAEEATAEALEKQPPNVVNRCLAIVWRGLPVRRSEEMPLNNAEEAQVLNRLDQLSPAGRREALRRLLPSAAWLDRAVERNRPRIEAIARERGLDWNSLSEEERQQFVDQLLHE